MPPLPVAETTRGVIAAAKFPARPAAAIEEQIPGCSVIRKTINELHHVPASFGYVNYMAACVITLKGHERTGEFDMAPRDRC